MNPNSKQLDQMARAKGFKDYAQWSAWNSKYGPGRKKGRSKLPQETQPRNVFEKIPIHPAGIMRRVADKYRKATGQ